MTRFFSWAKTRSSLVGDKDISHSSNQFSFDVTVSSTDQFHDSSSKSKERKNFKRTENNCIAINKLKRIIFCLIIFFHHKPKKSVKCLNKVKYIITQKFK